MKRILKGILLFFVALTAISASFLLYLRHCDWNGEEAAKYATENALKKSVGLCAMYVRKAMIAGGIPLYQGGNAWHYKYLLPILRFEEIDKNEEKKVGDIVVFQPIGKRRFGLLPYGTASNGCRTSSKEASSYIVTIRKRNVNMQFLEETINHGMAV